MVLTRLARHAELAAGTSIVKETHGRSIMLTRTLPGPREPRGQVFATDPQCFHMGGNLWEGDIEDVGGDPCVVCPLHRYRISLATGQHMNPCGGTCDSMAKQRTSMEQKQRTYTVNCDDTFIWVDVPIDEPMRPLPSDVYNPVMAAGHPGSTPPARGYGLGGAGASPARGYGLGGAGLGGQGGSQAPPATPPPALEPYSGVHARPMVPSPEQLSQQAVDMDADVAALSQQGGLQLSQASDSMHSPAPLAPPAAAPQGRINFPAQRAGLVRSRLAREAIAKRAYMPPMADRAKPQQQQQQQQQQQRRLAPGQSSLLDYGFSASMRGELTTAPESMDMET